MDEPVRQGRRGPVHDAALRSIMEADPAGACLLLGIPTPTSPVVLTASLPTATFAADLVLRMTPRRLVHVEYMRSGSSDLVARMLVYRGLLMRAHPRAYLSQHVLFLADGVVEGHDDLAANGFALDLNVVHLRTIEPEVLLRSPTLAPLAVLGRGSAEVRARALAEALTLIAEKGGERQHELLEFSTTLATITLDPNTIEKIVGEVVMTVESIKEFYKDTWMIREAKAEGREELLLPLLRERFGEQPGLAEVVQNLKTLPPGEAVHAVLAATTLADLTS